MALPGHRRTRSHKKRRASHFALKKQLLVKCPKCSKPILPHHACPFCGTYKGREILKVKSKEQRVKSKKDRK